MFGLAAKMPLVLESPFLLTMSAPPPDKPTSLWSEVRTIMDLVFDFSFKRFVTPHLIRILYALSLVNGYGFGWINGLSAPGSVAIWYAPVGLIGMVVASIASVLGLDGVIDCTALGR